MGEPSNSCLDRIRPCHPLHGGDNPTSGSSSKFHFCNGLRQCVCHAMLNKGGQPRISGQGAIGKAGVDGISVCQAIARVSTMGREAQFSLIPGEGGKAGPLDEYAGLVNPDDRD